MSEEYSNGYARGYEAGQQSVLKLAKQPAQQEPVSDRENAIIRFALHQFMSNAYSNMNAAAQDKDSRHYTVGAVEKFAKDAKDAEALLSRLQFKASKPAQRKPLTDEQMFEMAEIAWRHGWASCRDADYVGEEAEDERWGMVGAEVVQDIAAHGIKENT